MKQNIKTDIIRVRFLREGNTPSRPKRIRRHQNLVSYSVQENGKSIEKEKVSETWYTSMVKGSSIRLESATFLLEWAKGPTPTPKPKAKTDPEYRGFRTKDVRKLRSMLYSKANKTFRSYKKCRELLEERGSMTDVLVVPEVIAILDKKKKNKLFVKKQKPEVKRYSRGEIRNKLELLNQKYRAELKEKKRLARIEKEKEEPVLETT